MTASLLLTTSVDQRLNIWSYDSGEAMLQLTSCFTHDVADVASMELLRNRLAITTHNFGISVFFYSHTPLLARKDSGIVSSTQCNPSKMDTTGTKHFFLYSKVSLASWDSC